VTYSLNCIGLVDRERVHPGVAQREGKLAAVPGWFTYLDSIQRCFAEDPSVTATTLYRRPA
jgi:hypothetical protein